MTYTNDSIKNCFKKIIVMIFLVLLLAIIYIIANNVASIREAFLEIPLDWTVCIIIGILVKTVADYIVRSSRKKKKYNNSTKQQN